MVLCNRAHCAGTQSYVHTYSRYIQSTHYLGGSLQKGKKPEIRNSEVHLKMFHEYPEAGPVYTQPGSASKRFSPHLRWSETLIPELVDDVGIFRTPAISHVLAQPSPPPALAPPTVIVDESIKSAFFSPFRMPGRTGQDNKNSIILLGPASHPFATSFLLSFYISNNFF